MERNLSGGFLEEIDERKIRSSRSPLREELGRIDELLLSVSERGLLQPIIVRPLEKEDAFEVVAGNRRLHACKKLGLRKVPCYVMNLDDKEAYETSIVENLQRKSLNPIEEARAFRKYVKEFGYGSETELAGRLGKSPSYISRRIALLKLPTGVQEELLRSAKVSLAQELLSLGDDDKMALTSFIAESKLATSSDVRRVVRLVKTGEGLGQTTPDYLSYYTVQEARLHSLDRVIGKIIASLEVCKMRMDDVLNTMDKDEWVIKDILIQYRVSIHNQVDTLMKLRRRMRRELPPIDTSGTHHGHWRRKAPMPVKTQWMNIAED